LSSAAIARYPTTDEGGPPNTAYEYRRIVTVGGARRDLPFGATARRDASPGRRSTIVTRNALMGLPPVVIGLLDYLMLSISGPFGKLDLLFTAIADYPAANPLYRYGHRRHFALCLNPEIAVARLARIDTLVQSSTVRSRTIV